MGQPAGVGEMVLPLRDTVHEMVPVGGPDAPVPVGTDAVKVTDPPGDGFALSTVTVGFPGYLTTTVALLLEVP